jgi:hypothetical protein
MPAIQINLSERERTDAAARAAESGYASVEEYVADLVRADVELPVSEELEAEIARGLERPAREMTAADSDEKRRRLIERHRNAKAG